METAGLLAEVEAVVVSEVGTVTDGRLTLVLMITVLVELPAELEVVVLRSSEVLLEGNGRDLHKISDSINEFNDVDPTYPGTPLGVILGLWMLRLDIDD